MEKCVRISKFIIYIVASWAFSQDTTITVDGEMIPKYERSSIISQFDSLLVGKGEFGGKLTLVDFDSLPVVLFNYETKDERKTIDEILFQKKSGMNTPVLQQMFSNLMILVAVSYPAILYPVLIISRAEETC